MILAMMDEVVIGLLVVALPGIAGYVVALWLERYRFLVVPLLLLVLVGAYVAFGHDDAMVGILVSGVCLFTGYAVGRLMHDQDTSDEGWRRTIAIFVVVIVGLAAVPLAALGPYAYARYLESQWKPAKVKTRAELERHLHLYSTRTIPPKESVWGFDYALRKDERMVRYLILWSQPLDVVYDGEDRVVKIYTSYE